MYLLIEMRTSHGSKKKKEKTQEKRQNYSVFCHRCSSDSFRCLCVSAASEEKGLLVSMEEQMNVNFLDTDQISWDGESGKAEYAKASVDALTLAEADEKGMHAELSADPASIDLSQVGTVEVTWKLTCTDGYHQKAEKTWTRSITIADTKPPVITLKEESVSIVTDADFDPKTNIESVSDVVDGDIPYAEAEGNNAYTISSNVDTGTPGEYTVSIAALDTNGNKAEASYSVVVSQRPAVVTTYSEDFEPEAIGSPRYDPDELKTKINNYLSSYTGSEESWQVSVLFDGGEVAINTKQQQSASDMKLFVAGTVYENYDALCNARGRDNIDSNLKSMITISSNEA